MLLILSSPALLGMADEKQVMVSDKSKRSLDWHDLPTDLRRIILGKTGYMSFAQTLRAIPLYSRVCKQWNVLFHLPKVLNDLFLQCNSQSLSENEQKTLLFFLVVALSNRFLGRDKKAKLIDDLKMCSITPLQAGLQEGCVQIAKKVMVYGLGKNRKSPLHLAAQKDNSEALQVLLALGAAIETPNKMQSRPLFVAAKKGCVSAVKMLLASGADKESLNERGERALHSAAREGHPDVVHILLAAGAAINVCCDKGNSPLHAAVLNGREGVVKLLLQAGARINAPNKGNYRPLHCAARSGFIGIMKILLVSGADIEAESEFGNRPLHDAASHAGIEGVRVLLAYGADKTAVNKGGNVPAEYASSEQIRIALT